MRPYNPTGPTIAPTRSANGPNQRLLGAPYPSYTRHRRRVRRITYRRRRRRPLGEPVDADGNPSGSLSEPFSPLLRRCIRYGTPSEIEQFKLQIPPPPLDQDTWRPDLR